MEQVSTKIFVSYAREDKSECDLVVDFFSQLTLPFFRDVDRLHGGEAWEEKILDEARGCNFFIFLASRNSVEKPGMIQKELDIARSKIVLKERFRFLTIRLDEHPLPEWMGSLQYLNLSQADLFDRMAHSINDFDLEQRHQVQKVSGRAFINANPQTVSYATETCDYQYSNPAVYIVGEPFLSRELNSAIRGRVAERILEMRSYVEGSKLRFPEIRNEIAVYFIAVHDSPNWIGLEFGHYAHFSGAAHPQHHFMALNLSKSPWGLVQAYIEEKNLDEFIELVSEEVLRQPELLDIPSLKWNLRQFDWSSHTILMKDGIRVLFPDYSIGSYAYGTSAFEFTSKEINRLISVSTPGR